MSDRDPNRLDLSKYFTIEALEDELSVTISTEQTDSLYYCIDGDKDWKTLDNENPPTINTGQIISFKGEYTSGAIGTFSITKQCNLKGNIMSLLHGDYGGVNKTLHNYCFKNLFKDCTTIINAHELKLPSLNLTYNCYDHMFYNCTNLITAPELPATELEGGCYQYMFANTNITEVPYLPASRIYSYCYTGMFQNCNSLTYVNCFPDYLYFESYSNYNMNYMFYNCKNLTTVVLWSGKSFRSLPNYCFYKMFAHCSSLQSATFKNNNKMYGQNLGQYSCAFMFAYCSSLIQGPKISVSSMAFHGACMQMYDSCTSLIDASSVFESSAQDLYERCFAGMFSKCTSLTETPYFGSEISYKSACGNEIMFLMFYNCTSLTEVNLRGQFNFNNCTGCWKEMFKGCSNLSKIRILHDSSLRSNNTENWVKDVAPNGEFIIDYCKKHPEPLKGDSGIPTSWTCSIGEGVKQMLSPNITALSIEAEEPILWTGVIRVKATLTGDFILVNGSQSTTAIDFITIYIDENLSSEPVEKEISYTRDGITATTTVIQQPKSD